jgi:hypothetical protein
MIAYTTAFKSSTNLVRLSDHRGYSLIINHLQASGTPGLFILKRDLPPQNVFYPTFL